MLGGLDGEFGRPERLEAVGEVQWCPGKVTEVVAAYSVQDRVHLEALFSDVYNSQIGVDTRDALFAG